jgi:uncharacterized phage protein gp47/JayE
MANYVYLDNNGIITADTSDIKSEVQTEMQDALGSDVSLEDGTPQGRLIDMETEARVQVAINNAYISNMWNFNQASGLALDAWGANFGLEREGTASSRVTATVTGIAGTVISQGSKASTADGYMFYAENNITIGLGGSATGTFLSVEKGAIPCAANSLTKIIDGTLGWESINNTSPAILGNTKQSDTSFKQEFYNSGLFLGFSLWQDYENALNKVENVLSSYVIDNGEDSAVTVDGVTIAKHSLYACVDGGTNADVAAALLSRKSAGCNWTGNTSVSVVEPISGQTYTVKFDRPTPVNIEAAITIDTTNVSADNPQAVVQQAVYNYINTLKVGGDVYPFQLAAIIYEALSGVRITSLTINKSGDIPATTPITIHINEAAKVSALSDITVTIV